MMLFASIHFALEFVFLTVYGAHEETVFDAVVLKSMDHSIYEQWSSFSLLEKLPYILDEYLLGCYTAEYSSIHDLPILSSTIETSNGGSGIRMTNSEDISKLSNTRGIIYPQFEVYLSEFQFIDDIKSLFEECDEDGNGEIHIIEYIVCRGYYDATGNAVDGDSEFDLLESLLIEDYEEMLNKSILDEEKSGLHKFDEDGVIVDS